jgi:hypothetical protein
MTAIPGQVKIPTALGNAIAQNSDRLTLHLETAGIACSSLRGVLAVLPGLFTLPDIMNWGPQASRCAGMGLRFATTRSMSWWQPVSLLSGERLSASGSHPTRSGNGSWIRNRIRFRPNCPRGENVCLVERARHGRSRCSTWNWPRQRTLVGRRACAAGRTHQ